MAANPRDMGKFENAARGGLDPGTSNVELDTNDASSGLWLESRTFDLLLLSSIMELLLPKFPLS